MDITEGMDRTNHRPLDGEDGWELEHYDYDDAHGSALFHYLRRNAQGQVINEARFVRAVEIPLFGRFESERKAAA